MWLHGSKSAISYTLLASYQALTAVSQYSFLKKDWHQICAAFYPLIVLIPVFPKRSGNVVGLNTEYSYFKASI